MQKLSHPVTQMIRLNGVNHLAMATGDMDSTIRFWRDLIGMRLVAGLGEPGYRHYFFEVSPHDLLAFFEWEGVKPVSKEGTERLVRAAIEFALRNKRKSVTIVHKGNIMKFTEGAFRNWGYQLAKDEGLPVSSDVGAHHVHLSDMDLGYFDSHCRLIPPLRSQRDREALSAGLADGTIDCMCSDHTPVDEDQKQLPFSEAEPGATGLELLLPLALKWGAQRNLPLGTTLARITSDPARILGVQSGRLAVGAPADVVVFDPQAPVRISAAMLKSQGKNSPFLGYELEGRVRYTLVAGKPVYEGA